MANIKSAKKAIRVSARKAKVNLARDKKVKTAVKSVQKFSGTKTESLNTMSEVQKQLDKAVKLGNMHKNRANKLKSKLSSKLKSSSK